MRGLKPTLTLVCVLAALGLGAVAQADVTEWPTCSLPATSDGALCGEGRSPNGIVAGPDGGVWFTALGGDDIGRVSPSGALTLYPLPDPAPATTPRAPEGITEGADGALWFVEDFANRIGRVTTAGAFTFVDDPGARPNDIALGPDGALWVTEAGTNTIGHLVPGGALTHFPLPPSKAASGAVALSDITLGPDGRMWFSEIGSDRVGAISTAGAVSEYALPSGATPSGIAAGPDGRIWVAEFGIDKVARLTPAGSVDQLSLPGAGPSAIAAGPDGAMWIGEGRAAGVLRVTVSGASTETSLLFNPTVNGIAAGPDGAIWFTETGPNRVGRVTVPTPGGHGPVLFSVLPGGGDTEGGTAVTLRGAHLDTVTAVFFGGVAATAVTHPGSRQITASTPGHPAGPVAVTVQAGKVASAPSDAARFTFTTDATVLTAPAQSTPPPPPATPQDARRITTGLAVPVLTGGAGAIDVVAAVARARPSATGHRALHNLGRAKANVSAGGRVTLRLALKARDRRALRAGAHIEIAARLKDSHGRTRVVQRRLRLRR